MISKRLALTLVLTATAAACSAQENTRIVAAGAQIKKLAGDFALTARTSLYSIPMEVRGARTPIRPGQPRGAREGRLRSRQQ
ncbi:MAG: hypothetical protein KBE65_14860 [Phycisphaerae bacterium]|nr:hypothetical protein [Phycisphaerae bacterium]